MLFALYVCFCLSVCVCLCLWVCSVFLWLFQLLFFSRFHIQLLDANKTIILNNVFSSIDLYICFVFVCTTHSICFSLFCLQLALLLHCNQHIGIIHTVLFSLQKNRKIIFENFHAREGNTCEFVWLCNFLNDFFFFLKMHRISPSPRTFLISLKRDRGREHCCSWLVWCDVKTQKWEKSYLLLMGVILLVFCSVPFRSFALVNSFIDSFYKSRAFYLLENVLICALTHTHIPLFISIYHQIQWPKPK